MKKKHLSVSLFTLIFLFLISCSKNQELSNVDELNDTKAIKEKVLKLGFDTTKIVINDQMIIVEGDIVLYKQFLSRTTPRQASTVDLSTVLYPIDYARHRSLKYFIDASVSTWENGITASLLKYQMLESFNLRFERIYTSTGADLVFITGAPAGVWAIADVPANGTIGANIRITAAANSLSDAQKTWIMAHEIGHTIGFRHTNWRLSEGEFGTVGGISVGAYTIPGTPNSSNDPDPNSVFKSGVGMTSVPTWGDFSAFDKTALIYLYPSFGPAQLYAEPTGAFPVYPGNPVSAMVTVPNWREGGLTYQWHVQGITITSNTGNAIQGVVTDGNTAGIYCTITNSHGQSIAVSRSYGSEHID